MQPPSSLTEYESNRINRHVGHRLRERRTIAGFSRKQIAGYLDVSQQQVQKNEFGVNRMSADRLYFLSRLLDVPLEYFFAGLESERPPANLRGDALKIARCCNELPDHLQQTILALAKSLRKNS